MLSRFLVNKYGNTFIAWKSTIYTFKRLTIPEISYFISRRLLANDDGDCIMKIEGLYLPEKSQNNTFYYNTRYLSRSYTGVYFLELPERGPFHTWISTTFTLEPGWSLSFPLTTLGKWFIRPSSSCQSTLSRNCRQLLLVIK